MAMKETAAPAVALDGKGKPYVEHDIGEIEVAPGQKFNARVRAVLHIQIRKDRWVEVNMGEDIAKAIAAKLAETKL